jgi:hypothetical protein
MTDHEPDFSDSSQWRSRKYIKLSDEEILELYLKQLPEKDKYYLLKELDYRNLSESAKEKKLAATKKVMKSKQWWKYLPLLFALMFLVKRMFGT